MKSWTPEKAMRQILLGAKALGWTVLIPAVDEEEQIAGLILGDRLFTDDFHTDSFEAWDTTDEGEGH